MAPTPDSIQTALDILRHNMPEALRLALPTGIIALIFGVTLGILGAKLARWFIAVSFVVLGLMAGLGMSRATNLSPFMCAIFGGLVVGGIGFALHRLLVGAFAGVFLAGVALSVFSTEKILPHLPDFKQSLQVVPAGVEDFPPGPPATEAAAESWTRVKSVARQFGEYLVAKEPNVRKYGALIVLGAGLVGLLMGIFFCRLTLVLFTSAFATSLIATGLAMVGPAFGVDVYALSRSQPLLSAGGLAACFIILLILQSSLTRPAAPPPARKAE